jgi:hypothetical protein
VARTNKNSRLKGLPPRIALGEEDSVPTRGNGSIPFNDTKTIVFQEQSDINYGSKLDATSLHLSSELSSSLSGPGNIVAGISDTWKILSGSSGLNTDIIQPFIDSSLAAADGLSNNIEFFSDGSKVEDVGEGFSQPLWSKTKFEIDISSNPCSFKCAISQSKFTDSTDGDTPGYLSGSSYPMAYYNFESKMWEGIGTGWALQASNAETSVLIGDSVLSNATCWLDAIEYATIGFGPGIINLKAQIVNQLTSSVAPAAVAQQQQDYANHFLALSPPRQDVFTQWHAGHPIDTYGFPYAAKFHATSSQLLDMSNYISEPFLLEKIVLEVSGAQFTMFDTIDTGGLYSLTSSVFPATVNTFFILNQTDVAGFNVRSPNWRDTASNDLKFEIPKLQELTANSQPQIVSSLRDLVTYGNITAYTNDLTDNPTQEIKLINPDGLNSASSFTDVFSQTLGAEVGMPLYSYIRVTQGTAVAGQDITSSYDLLSAIQRECNIHLSQSMSSSIDNLSWNQNISANFPVRSPFAKTFFVNTDPIMNVLGNVPFNYGGFERGGSNGLGFEQASFKRLRTEFRTESPIAAGDALNAQQFQVLDLTQLYNISTNDYLLDATSFVRNIQPDNSTTNPYLLFPTDKLVFGWQLPIPRWIASQTSFLTSTENRNHFNTWQHYSIPPRNAAASEIIDICQMSFDGPAKVIFYGSYLSQDKESHGQSDTVVVSTPSISRTIIG